MNNEEAIKRIKDHIRVHHIGEYPHIKIEEALNIAISALEVDTVPVVRCKDCVHYKKVKGAINGWCECEYIPFDTDPEDFCSFGERKVNA